MRLEADHPRGASASSVAVVIPNWNGAHLLPACLAAVRAQTLGGVEIVVVDDGSTDDSVALLRREHPDVTLVQNERQKGFCGAVNAGITATKGDYVALLNNDATPEPGWLERSIERLRSIPRCAGCTPKILLAQKPGTINSIGIFLKPSGASRDIGFDEPDDGRYGLPSEVFGFSGCAVVLKKAAIDEVGLFDEWLFIYGEDLDWSLRARLRGYTFHYEPSARVHHQMSATFGRLPKRTAYLRSRNSLYVLLKNLPASSIARHAVRLLAFQVYQVFRSARGRAGGAALKGKLDVVRSLGLVREARRRSLHSRRIPVGDLERALGAGPLVG